MRSFRTFAFATLAASGVATVWGCSGDRLTRPADEIRAARVSDASAINVRLTPSVDTVGAGDSVTLKAQVTGSHSSSSSVTWKSQDSTVAAVGANGTVRGLRAGTTYVVASVRQSLLNTATDTATIVVVASASPGTSSTGTSDTSTTTKTVASVTVTPTGVRLTPGQSATLAAATLDSSGAPLSGHPVVWSSSASAVATVDTAGVVRAVAAGTATITATAGGKSGTSSVTVANATVTSVTVSLNSASLNVAQTTQALATARDASNNVITGRTVSWTSSNATVATVNGSGLVTAVGAGSASITATVDGVSGSASLAVLSSTTSSTPITTAPLPAGSIALSIARMDGGSGAAIVSNGIPLEPGALRPGQGSLVRVIVGGVEQPVYVEELAGRHPDGSLRAVLVEFRVPSLSTGSPLAGSLALGQARTTTDLTALLTNAQRGTPQAAALPSDPAYLARTDLLEATPQAPLVSVAQVKALGGSFGTYESNFSTYSEQHWAAEGSTWDNDYYDRANIYYAWWARTGNPEYWRRATLTAMAYRTNYLEPNNYGASPHWAQLEGLEKHYLLTGDPSSRFAVARVAEVFAGGFMSMLGDTTYSWMDGRIQARVLQSFFLAWRLDNAQGNSPQDWAGLMDAGLTKVVGSQNSLGGFDFVQQCYYTQNFMTGMVNDQLIRQYTYYKADPRIVTLVKKATDYMWSTQWDPNARAFKYLGGSCTGQGDATPSPDLNGFMLTSFGWLYRQTGNAAYRDQGDQVLAGGVAGAWLSGSKQFNENYTSSFRYFGFR